MQRTKFQLDQLLGDTKLAKDFEEGAMVISRLCPVDYHRFHFPVKEMYNLPFN